jgi:hypothetical protein
MQTPAPARGEGPGSGRPPQGDTAPRFEGHDGRECGEHRTTGHRAWCFECSEWCYPNIPCRGCELPALRKRVEQAENRAALFREQVRMEHERAEQAEQTLRAVEIDRDQWRDRAHALRAALDADQPKETP